MTNTFSLQLRQIVFALIASMMICAPLIKVQEAKAFPVTVIGDIVQDIKDGISSALGNAFAHFASSFLQNLLNKIEQNYKIANFLYYTDALVSGQYLQDYLNKYVPDSLDQQTVLALIPQFSCGKTPDLSSTYQQKARDYLGYDPNTLSPNDPQYFEKLARMGNYLSSPNGWSLYYQGLATSAESQAENAASQEITSSGLKSAHDPGSGNIVTSVNSVIQEEAGAVAASLNLGTSNPTNIVGQLATSLTYQFLNNFIFKGAVFNEQATCLSGNQLTPIAPASAAAPTYVSPDTVFLKASQQNVNPGTLITLAWDASTVSGAVKAILAPLSQEVKLTGQTDVTVNASTVYTLSVYDVNGNVLRQSSVSISVDSGPRGAPGPGQ